MALRQEEIDRFELGLGQGAQLHIQAGNKAELCAARARGDGVKWEDLRDFGEVESIGPCLMRCME